jgi:GPH family glycoside/pentoside/hexuronide:cation symporter
MSQPTSLVFGKREGWRYGLMGLPLAFAALPLYVHLPHRYGQDFGLSLGLLGALLLAVRLLDAVLDPWLGSWCDRLFARSPHAILRVAAVAAALLGLGMWALFLPPTQVPLLPWLSVGLIVVYLAFSLLTIAHQSWGARLGGEPLLRARIVAWREGLGLLGVLAASVLPSLVSWGTWVSLLGLALLLAWWHWRAAPQPQAQGSTAAHADAVWAPWRQARFRQLLLVFVVNGSASALPATLVLFFIQDRLGGQAYQGLFLGLYFLAAAASLPMWLRLVRSQGLMRSWGLGMVLSVLVFAWVVGLGQGDFGAFGLICLLSGAALGADMAIPGALLAVLVAQHGEQERLAGTYFGWWHVATKLNLALAAGLGLPLLTWLGYSPGLNAGPGLQALSWVYGALPCALKITAALLLWRLALAWPQQPHQQGA